MADDIPKELLKNGELYDFYTAIEEFGFDWEEFSNNNFQILIEETFINNFISFRKGYLERDFTKMQFFSHKFKGQFKLFISPYVYTKCEELQTSIQKGDIYVQKLYVEIVQRMQDFLKAIIEFAKKINNPISNKLLDDFWKNNNLCNEFEDKVTMSMINKQSDLNIKIDTSSTNACCGVTNLNDCIII